MKELHVYTDGSSIRNPGIGGWAFCIVDPVRDFVLSKSSGSFYDTTNNRMELMGAIKGLREVISRGYHKKNQIIVISDSQYVVKGISEWIVTWKRQSWVGVKNRDLWEGLDSSRNSTKATFRWVRGHNGNHYNEYADRLAKEAALEAHYEF